MKKLIVVVEPDRFRAYRVTAEKGQAGLNIRTTEVEPSPTAAGRRPGTNFEEPQGSSGRGFGRRHRGWEPDEVAALLAVRIGSLVMKERPALWNLVAPAELLEPLLGFLGPKARASLTRTIEGDLRALDLDEVEGRFRPATASPAQ